MVTTSAIRVRIRAALRMGLSLSVFLPQLALASSLMVTPVALQLDAETSSQLLTVTNRGDRAVRFEVSVFAWAQDENGETVLTPTENLVVFPVLYSLPPGAEKILRAELAGGAVPKVERAYRVLIEELAPPRTESDAGRVIITMNLSVPVFARAVPARGEAALAWATVEAGHLRFRLVNSTGTHVRLRGVSIGAENASATPRVAHELPAWYLLAGGVRDFDVPLEGAECAAAMAYRLEVRWDDGNLSRRVPVAPGSCP